MRNASDSPCAAMKRAAHAARSASGQHRQQLGRVAWALRERRGGRADQGPRPVGVALPDGRPAPGRVQILLPARRRPAARRSLRRSARRAARSTRSGAASTNCTQPPGAFPPPGGRLRARRRHAAWPRRTRAAPRRRYPRRAFAGSGSRRHARTGTRRHAGGQRGAGEAASSSAAVARTVRLRSASACSRNGSSAGHRPSAQRVEEHQPVLGPLRGPGEASSASPAAGRAGAGT